MKEIDDETGDGRRSRGMKRDKQKKLIRKVAEKESVVRMLRRVRREDKGKPKR